MYIFKVLHTKHFKKTTKPLPQPPFSTKNAEKYLPLFDIFTVSNSGLFLHRLHFRVFC